MSAVSRLRGVRFVDGRCRRRFGRYASSLLSALTDVRLAAVAEGPS